MKAKESKKVKAKGVRSTPRLPVPCLEYTRGQLRYLVLSPHLYKEAANHVLARQQVVQIEKAEIWGQVYAMGTKKKDVTSIILGKYAVKKR